jgi:hypothetical protein
MGTCIDGVDTVDPLHLTDDKDAEMGTTEIHTMKKLDEDPPLSASPLRGENK